MCLIITYISAGRFYQEIWTFDPLLLTWNTIVGMGPSTGLEGHRAFERDNKIYFLHGYTTGYNINTDVFVYDHLNLTNPWTTERTNYPPTNTRCIPIRYYVFD